MEAEVWTVIGVLIATVVGMFGLFVPKLQHVAAELIGRMDKLESQVRELDHHMAGRLDALGARLDRHLVAHGQGG